MARVCQFCHTACSDDTKSCPNCGSRLPAPGVNKPTSIYDDHGHPHSTVGPDLPEPQPFWKRKSHVEVPSAQKPRTASPYTWSPTEHPHNSVPRQTVSTRTLNGTPTEHSMVWYTLLISFILFVNALVYLVNGVAALNGELYDVPASTLYLYVPALEMVDKLTGIARIALAVLAVFTRIQLAHFKRNGPALLYMFILGGIMVTVAYTAAAASALSVLGSLPMDTLVSNVFSVVFGFLYLLANMVYFRKRANKFINL